MIADRRLITLLATVVATAAVGAGSASGSAGGLAAPSPPEVRDVICVSGCLDVRAVAVGGKIAINGKSLSGVERVQFAGRVSATPKSVEDKQVTVKVPDGAKDGRISVVTPSGQSADSPVELKVSGPKALDPHSGFSVTSAVAKPRRAYFYDRRKASVAYIFKGRSKVDVRIDVVSRETGAIVDSIVQRNRKPYSNQSAHWDGLDQSNRIPRGGKYEFKITPLGTADGRPGKAKFSYYDHTFPLRGARPSYGDGLGAGRGHQGQDVFARCGTKVVAARGGVVQTSKYQSAAGYYVVIDGARTGRDYTYMHLAKRGRPKPGQRIRTGERIGFVSDTGRASGCHLHFELWSAPGWYEGGKPLSPTRLLKRWQKWG